MRMRVSRGFLLGAGTVTLAYLLRKPLKKAAVSLAGGFLALGEKSRELYYNIKEEAEDIIAEAGYEHMKSQVEPQNDEPTEINQE